MKSVLGSFLVAVFLMFFVSAKAAEKPHAVIVVGTHHYTPQKSMPGFAAELEQLGFRTTVINPEWDPEKDKRGVPGLEALKTADVGVFFIRFLKLEDDQLKHITEFVKSGKPVVGLRTTTHGFNYPKGHPQSDLNMDFGRDVLGTPYQIHLNGKTDIKIADGAGKHPILTGVSGEWESPGTLYLTKLQPGTEPLLVGTGRAKAGKRTNQFGTHDLKEEMTDVVAWTWKNKWGGRVFTSSLGHLGDFDVPQSMRVMVNGVFWAAGQPVPSAETPIRTLNQKAPAPSKNAKKPEKKARAPKGKVAAKPAGGLEDVRIAADDLTIFYGNSFIERQQDDGSLEALLHAANGGKPFGFRSLAYSADEVGFRIRPSKFGDHLGYISDQLPCKRVVMCFGMNESFAGAAGIEKFRKDLEAYLSIIKGRHPESEYVLVSPTAVEAVDFGDFPDPGKRNADIALYCEAMKDVAQ